jgi:hypothetical protein
MWETLGDFTQATGWAYTLFPTTIYDISLLFWGQLSASSTGPIKSNGKFKERIGVS